MYALIKTGGKQYKVEEGKWIDVELLHKEAGESVEFNEVLLISNGDDTKIGTPLLNQAKVTGKVQKDLRGKKVIIYKMRPKKHYRKKAGHRQNFTRVMIEKIEG